MCIQQDPPLNKNMKNGPNVLDDVRLTNNVCQPEVGIIDCHAMHCASHNVAPTVGTPASTNEQQQQQQNMSLQSEHTRL